MRLGKLDGGNIGGQRGDGSIDGGQADGSYAHGDALGVSVITCADGVSMALLGEEGWFEIAVCCRAFGRGPAIILEFEQPGCRACA